MSETFTKYASQDEAIAIGIAELRALGGGVLTVHELTCELTEIEHPTEDDEDRCSCTVLKIQVEPEADA